MNNKEAIQIAKAFVTDVYSDDRISDIALEGISRDPDDTWEVIIGFDRPAPSTRTVMGQMTDEMNGIRTRSVRRVYKRLIVDDLAGKVKEMLPVE
jgi:hypothetical protein